MSLPSAMREPSSQMSAGQLITCETTGITRCLVAGVAPKYHQTNSGSNRTQLHETASVEHLHSMPLAKELEAKKASQQLHTKEVPNRTEPNRLFTEPRFTRFSPGLNKRLKIKEV